MIWCFVWKMARVWFDLLPTVLFDTIMQVRCFRIQINPDSSTYHRLNTISVNFHEHIPLRGMAEANFGSPFSWKLFAKSCISFVVKASTFSLLVEWISVLSSAYLCLEGNAGQARKQGVSWVSCCRTESKHDSVENSIFDVIFILYVKLRIPYLKWCICRQLFISNFKNHSICIYIV